MVKRRISKENLELYKKKIYSYFRERIDQFEINPETRKRLANYFELSINEIALVIKEINSDPNYKYVIKGTNEGYYICTGYNYKWLKEENQKHKIKLDEENKYIDLLDQKMDRSMRMF